MKYLRQFLIILAVSFAGELLNLYLPLPVPASIYGMVIMFTCLATGFIPLEKAIQAISAESVFTSSFSCGWRV